MQVVFFLFVLNTGLAVQIRFKYFQNLSYNKGNGIFNGKVQFDDINKNTEGEDNYL